MTEDSLPGLEQKGSALPLRPSVKKASRWIALGTTLTAFGLALSLTDNPNLGGSLALCGLATCIAGLHRYGRSGKAPED